MDLQVITLKSELERMLFDESAEPKALPLSLLKHITSGFSDTKKIGYGGFAAVYKGTLDNGMVAVKKLLKMVDIDEKKFTEEVRCLMKAKQKNIVRFLGYCYDIQGEMLECEGKLVMEEVRERILCFEYLPKGSLDKYISDASQGLGWRHRYQIISGICDGLYYLHQKCIVHLDLKPSNILLDDNMMPKIIDFGLSRCFDEKKSRSITSKLIGSLGYLAPEFYAGRITFKLDIYSLGIIIIEILTGQKGYTDIDNVLKRWKSRLDKKKGGIQQVQLRVCTEIAMECTDSNPAKRPDMQHILDRLCTTKGGDESGTETLVSSSSSVEQLADVPPGLTVDNMYLQIVKFLQLADVPPGLTVDNTRGKLLRKRRRERVEMAHFEVHASSDKRNNNMFLLHRANPDKLMIDRLENLRSAEEAWRIKLAEKENIEDLAFKWTLAAERFVDDIEVLEMLVPPSSVKKLSIDGYSSANVPYWLMSIKHYLANLLEIYLCGFPNCNNLPPLGQLQNLKVLTLCRMEGLEEWRITHSSGEEGANEILFPKLKRLNIEHCPKLRIKPCLPRAMSLHILDCDVLLSSQGHSSHRGASFSSPITDLFVVDSKLPMLQWRLLHQLPALRMLTIERCSDLNMQQLGLDNAELPSWLVELRSLHSLNLWNCSSMTSLPQWFGQLTFLERFQISCCDMIRSLPDSIQLLTKLEYLHIDGCPALAEWSKSDENMMKLAHISKKFLHGQHIW